MVSSVPKSIRRSFVLLFLGALGFGILMNLAPDQNSVEADMEKMSNSELREISGQSIIDFTIQKGTTDISGNLLSKSTKPCGYWDSCGTYTYEVEQNIRNTHQHFVRLGLDAQIKINDPDDNWDGVQLDGMRVGHYDSSTGQYGVGDGDNGFVTDCYSESGGNTTCEDEFLTNAGTNYGPSGLNQYHGPFFQGYNGCIQANQGVGVNCSNRNNTNEFDIVSPDGLVLAEAGSGSASNTKIEVRNPYVELAFENFGDNDQSNNRLVGIRVGADAIRGGAAMKSITRFSGSIYGTDFSLGEACGGAGHRVTDCGSTTFVGSHLSLFNKLSFGSTDGDASAGDEDGWTEDFWFSFNAKNIIYDANNPAKGTSNMDEAQFHTDGAGFWIHATDDVQGGLT